MFDKDRIREGMTVRSISGDKLGKVRSLYGDKFEIEKGFFFKEDYEVPYSAVSDIRDGELWLYDLSAQRTAPMGTGSDRRDEARMTLSEEQLSINKQDRQVGEVELHKVVETQHQSISVPVRKERVVVERVPATSTASADHAFEEQSIRIPVHEEEVELRKRPVVREEVRVSTREEIEERTIGDEIRRERLDVDTEGGVRPLGYTGQDPDER